MTGTSVRPRVRHGAVLVVALTLAGTAACTGGDAPSGVPEPTVTRPPTATVEETTPPAVEPRVRVTRVAGKLKQKDREVLAANVGKVVNAYFEDAFTGGEYPRESFGEAFTAFSAGAARQADAQRDLLTNRVLGPTTQQVVVRRQTAYLSVLAPHDVAAGVTARVHLRFVADQGDDPAKRVDVRGRLMLTRKKDGSWMIFGYDLSRDTRNVGEGSR